MLLMINVANLIFRLLKNTVDTWQGFGAGVG